jgi:FkbM family methyltransferase
MGVIDINMSEYVNLVESYLDVSDINVVFEIGSLDGNDSIFFKEQFPNADVYAIEGLTENYEKYMKGLTTITPINVVVADYDGNINYHKKEINGIHGIRNRGDEYGKTVLEGVICKRMDTLCGELGVTAIDMVKIDVEGATQEILTGFGNILKTVKIMHIETEAYPFFEGQVLHSEVSRYLIENGFTMIELSSVEIGVGVQHDSVWVNNQYLQKKKFLSDE